MTKHRNPVTTTQEVQEGAWSAPFTGTSQHVSHVLHWEQPSVEDVPAYFQDTTPEVKHRSWERGLGWTMFIMSLSALCLTAFLRIQTQSETRRAMYKCGKEREVLLKMEEATRKLQLQVSRLRSPARLSRIAKIELGMKANAQAMVSKLPARKKKKKLRLAHSSLRRKSLAQ